MLHKEKMDRLNHLAKKKKAQGLDREEQEEQKLLREEYLVNFRNNFRDQLDQIKFVEDLVEEGQIVEEKRKN